MGGLLRGLIAIFVLTLVAIPSIASDQAQATKAGQQTGTHAAPGLRTLVSIDAEDAYLPTVLSILAAKSEFNIVTGPGVSDEERISIHLKDAPIEEAMNLVVRAAGLSYEIIGNSFLVAKSSKLKEQVGQNAYVLALQYANAIEVQELLSDFAAEVKVDPSGNKLLVIATPKVLTDIERVVKNIDQPVLQITLSARLIEVSVEEEERLGINWSKLSTSSSVFLYEGDVEPQTTAGGGSQLQPFQRTSSIDDVGTMWRSQPIWEIALDWLLKNSNSEVLASTSVSTQNAKKAMIELVDVVPYVTSAGGVGGQVSTQEEEVGIKLEIEPRVNSDGYITVSIVPEVSSIFEFIGPDQTIPRVVRRRASMTVRVKNHQSIIVGGLMSLVAGQVSHKVPFLGDLPFLGPLFRYNVSVASKTDLIIEVTPHIIEDEYTSMDKSGGSNTFIMKSKEIKTAEERYHNDLFPGEEEESQDGDE